MVVTTTAFLDLTNQVVWSFDLPTARIASVQHPLGGISEADVYGRAQSMVEDIVRLFTTVPLA